MRLKKELVMKTLREECVFNCTSTPSFYSDDVYYSTVERVTFTLHGSDFTNMKYHSTHQICLSYARTHTHALMFRSVICKPILKEKVFFLKDENIFFSLLPLSPSLYHYKIKEGLLFYV